MGLAPGSRGGVLGFPVVAALAAAALLPVLEVRGGGGGGLELFGRGGGVGAAQMSVVWNGPALLANTDTTPLHPAVSDVDEVGVLVLVLDEDGDDATLLLPPPTTTPPKAADSEVVGCFRIVLFFVYDGKGFFLMVMSFVTKL